MGKFDKDRFQKEQAVRYCLARGMFPFMEVLVPSAADLSDSVEVLTDIDVLGVEVVGDGEVRRTVFDCKTGSKLSAVNRAFWASGVLAYAECHQAFVILKNKPVHNHRMSALTIGVDLHDESSFQDLGKSLDPAFPNCPHYQGSIDRWNSVFELFEKNAWSEGLYKIGRNVVPLTRSPSATFRRFVAELTEVKGQFDPAKDAHLAIFFDCLASFLILLTSIARDIRRFYEPAMSKAEFERVLRYYMWGGKESYQIRQRMRDKVAPDAGQIAIEMPAWNELVGMAGLIVSAPQSIFACAHICRELAFRLAGVPDSNAEAKIKNAIAANSRIKQFSIALVAYLLPACGLPKDLGRNVQSILLAI